MADFYTDMKTLLTATKNRLLAYQTTTLSEVKTWKRGVLPPIPTFPAIAILPGSERLYSPRSGGAYRNDRELQIQIYKKGLGSENILRATLDIAEAVKDILKTEYQLDDTEKNTYDLVIGDMQYGDPQPFRNAILQEVMIPITCKSFESVPSGSRSLTLTDTGPKDLLDKIYTTITGYSFTAVTGKKERGTLPPVARYPSIHVLEDQDMPERYEAGIDRPIRRFSIAVFNKQLDKEALLDSVLDVTEEVKDCLQEDPTFGGDARNSWITDIQYGTWQEQTHILYSAFIGLDVYGYDPVR